MSVVASFELSRYIQRSSPKLVGSRSRLAAQKVAVALPLIAVFEATMTKADLPALAASKAGNLETATRAMTAGLVLVEGEVCASSDSANSTNW
jgi:hypothetical protein